MTVISAAAAAIWSAFAASQPGREFSYGSLEGYLTAKALVMALKLDVQLTLLIPAVENAIAGNAYRPGDVIRTRAGLAAPESGFSPAEAGWVVTRLAELLGWPEAGLPPG